MTPNLEELADRVWDQTLPALRRRRITRRALTGAITIVPLAIVILLTLPSLPTSDPTPIRAALTPANSEVHPDSSLAVLIVDQSGVRFEQLRSEQLADEDLNPSLSLDPVITGRIPDYN
jgi:hypothetical protein